MSWTYTLTALNAGYWILETSVQTPSPVDPQFISRCIIYVYQLWLAKNTKQFSIMLGPSFRLYVFMNTIYFHGICKHNSGNVYKINKPSHCIRFPYSKRIHPQLENLKWKKWKKASISQKIVASYSASCQILITECQSGFLKECYTFSHLLIHINKNRYVHIWNKLFVIAQRLVYHMHISYNDHAYMSRRFH